MKKTRTFGSMLVFGASALVLAACGGGQGGGGAKEKIVIWVGEESAKFYTQVCNEYVAANPDFNFTVEVKSQDTGTAAATVISDPSAAADIFTVAHDNVGKLVQKKLAKPLSAADLVEQVNADNPASFVEASSSTLGDDKGTKYLYGAPYISQALFLMYNTKYVSAEQAKTFEGLRAAAAAKSSDTKGWTVTGTDGFNFSFTLLARKDSDKSTTLKLYEGGIKTKGACWAQGDDEVASAKWVQKSLKDPNAMMWPSNATWAGDIRNEKALAVIGGAWHFETFSQSVGSENVGIAMIPTYELTSETAFGTATAGTVMRGGTFADCKIFMINGSSKSSKYAAEQKLIKYLSSKEMQEKSFIACNNMPAYSGFADRLPEIKAANPDLADNSIKLAQAQSQMAQYGIPQPFISGTLNTYFYSKGAPELMKVICDQYDTSTKTEVYLTDREIQEGLYKIQYIWQHGQTPEEVPATLPAEID